MRPSAVARMVFFAKRLEVFIAECMSRVWSFSPVDVVIPGIILSAIVSDQQKTIRTLRKLRITMTSVEVLVSPTYRRLPCAVFQQIIAFGYQNMPLEVEAVNETNRIWGIPLPGRP